MNSSAASPSAQYTECTETGCYGSRFAGQLLTCPRCGSSKLLYSRKPASVPAGAKRALLRQWADGTIEALSSNGRDIYTVSIGTTPSCTCPGFAYRGRCYHVRDAQQQFVGFYKRPLRWHPSRRYDLLDDSPTGKRAPVPFPGTYCRDAACDCPSCSPRPAA